jgi:hypothetical protein
MRRHVTIAAFVLALAAYSVGQENYRAPQDQTQAASTQADAKLSKKDRKRQEKEEKKTREQERKEQKHEEKRQAEEQRKQDKDQEKTTARERNREQKADEKEVAGEHKREEKYQRKEDQRAERADAKEMKRHAEQEARNERVAAAAASRIPISTTATPGLLLAQREVGRAIYSQAPGSDVHVLLADGNQIILRGSAPTPSWRQRLLQVAIGAARGYSVVDQLAANLVGNAAGAATSAAMSGVGNLIHGSAGKDGSGGRDSAGGKDNGPEPGPEIAQQSPSDRQELSPNSDREVMAGMQQAVPNSDSGAMPVVLEPGSNACVNLSNSNQVLLTGQVASQPSADLIRHFAHQLANPATTVVDQLAVRTNGTPSAASPMHDVTSVSDGVKASSMDAPATMLSQGSAVCVSENNRALFLTGTVGSTAELGAVESAVEPLVGSGRLLDHLTVGSTSSGTQVAGSAAAPTAVETLPANNVSATPDTQNAVEQALYSVPRLSNVNVQFAADGLHLSGSVDTPQDGQMAADLAREYAPGQAVLNNITVASGAQPPQAQPPRQ